MTEINSLISRLSRYALGLRKRIDDEESALRFLGPLPDSSNPNYAMVEAAREKVARTITAYNSALSDFYSIFPEIKK